MDILLAEDGWGQYGSLSMWRLRRCIVVALFGSAFLSGCESSVGTRMTSDATTIDTFSPNEAKPDTAALDISRPDTARADVQFSDVSFDMAKPDWASPNLAPDEGSAGEGSADEGSADEGSPDVGSPVDRTSAEVSRCCVGQWICGANTIFSLTPEADGCYLSGLAGRKLIAPDGTISEGGALVGMARDAGVRVSLLYPDGTQWLFCARSEGCTFPW